MYAIIYTLACHIVSNAGNSQDSHWMQWPRCVSETMCSRPGLTNCDSLNCRWNDEQGWDEWHLLAIMHYCIVSERVDSTGMYIKPINMNRWWGYAKPCKKIIMIGLCNRHNRSRVISSARLSHSTEESFSFPFKALETFNKYSPGRSQKLSSALRVRVPA